MSEYIKYNPANYSPEHFLLPKTAVLWPELKYLNNKLVTAVEGSMRMDKRSMLIGSEFEVMFFDENYNPPKNRWDRYQNDKRRNPNYSSNHKERVTELAKSASRFGVSGNRFQECTKEGSLLLEFRTAPQTYNKYLSTVSYLRDWIHEKSTNGGLLPIVYSQHTHITSNRTTRFHLMGRDEPLNVDADEGVIQDAFSRVTPLVLLPEEYEESRTNPPAVIGRNGHSHPEFRMLSSEYACDPVLNLTLVLRAFYASMYNPDFVTGRRSIPRDFCDAVTAFSEDQEMEEFFGTSTVSTLAQIVSQYPLVSTGAITVDQIVAN